MKITQTLEYTFPKDCRIRKHNLYQLLFRKGRRIALPHFVIYYLVNDSHVSRLGTTVSRKVGNAIIRNHCKRQLKDFFRLTRHLHVAPLDLSIVARPGAAMLSTQQIYDELLDALTSASLVKFS